MFNGVIYCTTNLVNGRKYIGLDSYNKPNYFGSGSIIRQALSLYGKQNFVKEILEDGITNEQDLNEAEQYWINYFGAVKSDLFYNIIPGGKQPIGRANNHKRRECAKVDLNSGFILDIKLSPKLYSESGFIPSSISKCCRGEIKSHKGFSWRYIDDDKKLKSCSKQSKKVVQVDKSLNLIKVWDSANKAAEHFFNSKLNPSILMCCNKNISDFKSKSKGYYFIYLEDYDRYAK